MQFEFTCRRKKATTLKARKVLKNKVYEYRYSALFLNIYLPKGVVEEFGSEFCVFVDRSKGVVVAVPVKLCKEDITIEVPCDMCGEVE